MQKNLGCLSLYSLPPPASALEILIGFFVGVAFFFPEMQSGVVIVQNKGSSKFKQNPIGFFTVRIFLAFKILTCFMNFHKSKMCRVSQINPIEALLEKAQV